VEARAGAELRSPLDPLSGVPGLQEQLTVADASAHDAATATREWLPHELRERAVLDRVPAHLRQRRRATSIEGGCSAALGAQCCSCFERQPASSSCARKTPGGAAAASAAELRYPCAPPFLLTRGGRKPDAFLRDYSGGDEAPTD
jgi:hypothetical protein